MVDIQSAYRSVSVNHWSLDGKEIYLLDHCLCFDLQCGPFYFNMLSNFIYGSLVEVQGIKLVNYLDDYNVISDSYDSCIKDQDYVISLLRYVGLQISWSKVSPPLMLTHYLAIEVDSQNMELRLPKDKIEKMLCLIKQFRVKPSVSRKDIQRKTGSLAHCATLVKGRCSYTRRLYDLEKIAETTKMRCVKLTTES